MRSQPRRLPFFVYGTLRPGGHYHAVHLAGRCAEIRPAVLPDAQLHGGPGYPYAVRAPGRHVVGDLVVPRPELYPAVLADLDRLEGCRPDGSGEYVRVRLTVTAMTGTAEDGEPAAAWVYLAGPAIEAELRRTPAPIDSGDWLRR